MRHNLTKIVTGFGARRHRVRSFDAELLDAVTQRAEGDAELLCRGSFVVAGLLERFDDRLALDLLEMRAERRAAFGGCPETRTRLTLPAPSE
jgi:hypothetical protein